MLSKCFENAVPEMVLCKCFFWHQPETCFWLCCGSIFYIMLSELRFVKWLRFFERNCIVKWVIFLLVFAGFEFLLALRICFLVQISFFGAVLGHFSQCNFEICRQPNLVTDIFTHPLPPQLRNPPHHKKASCDTDKSSRNS